MKYRTLILALLTSACAATLAGCDSKKDDTAYKTKSALTVAEQENDGAQDGNENCTDGNCDGNTSPDKSCPDGNCPDEIGDCPIKKPRVIFKRRGGSAVGFYGGANGTFFFIIGDGNFEEMPLPDDDFRVRPPHHPTEPKNPEDTEN